MQWGLPWPGGAMAAEAEAAGATAFCAGEFADLSAYVTAAGMAHATSTAMIGPGIAYAFARSPFVHAASIRHLSKHAAGRCSSASVQAHTDEPRLVRRRRRSPAPRMAELIEVIRMFLHAENGEPIRYQGDYYSIGADIRAPVFGRLEVPILIGAFNKIMIRTAGRTADGVLGHGLFTDRWWEEVVESPRRPSCSPRTAPPRPRRTQAPGRRHTPRLSSRHVGVRNCSVASPDGRAVR